MIENVDGYEVARLGETISLRFTDLFGEGEIYYFDLTDARVIRDALTTALLSEEPPPDPVNRG
jgi:hypothetical protein